MGNGDDLMAEWEEFKRFENFQKSKAEKAPEPEPEPVNPHHAYTQGSSGQLVSDWKAFRGTPTPDQLAIRSTAPDRRFNDDPVEFYAQVCVDENRKGLAGMVVESVNGKVTHLELP